MFGYKFYHATTTKHVIAFGTLFNQIYIDRTDADGNITSTIRVPIVYGPRDKALSRVETNPDFEKKFSANMPFMSFELIGWRYDGSRHSQSSQKEVGRNANKNLASWMYTPVPYTFTFQLVISTKFIEDSLKISETIAPFFTPDWTFTLKLIDEPIITKDVAVILKDHQIIDSWQGSYNEKREIQHIMTFDMHGFLFGPSQKSKIIKVAKGQVLGTGTEQGPYVTVTPGLTADGKPTDNPAETVSWSEISWEDDYGYITTYGNLDE